MAFSPGTVWEPRATGDSGFNGSGFDPALGGADYSQQNSPQAVYTDLVLTASSGVFKLLSSVARPFVANDKGNAIWLNVPVPGWFQVVSVAAGVATLDRQANASGQTGLTGRLGGGSSALFVGWMRAVAPGNIVWLKGTGWVSGASGNGTSLILVGSVAAPVRVRGYSSFRGDGGRAKITADPGASTTVVDYSNSQHTMTEDVEFDCGANNFGVRGVFVGPDNRFERAIFRGNNVGVQASLGLASFRKCFFTGSGQKGLYCGSDSGIESSVWVDYCRFTGIGRSGQAGVCVDDPYGGVIIEESLFDNSYIGIRRGAAFKSKCRRSVFDMLSVAALQLNNANTGVALGTTWFKQNILSRCGKGIDNQSGITPDPAILAKNYGGNAFRDNTDNFANFSFSPGDEALTVDPFEDVDGGDYRLNVAAGGGATVRAMEQPGTFADGLQTILGEVGFGASTVSSGGGGTIELEPPINDFDEVRLPVDIARGATGGPMYKTQVVVTGSGSEQRNAQWSDPLYKWTIGYGARDIQTANTLMEFFLARQGKARGFRFKDWRDYRLELEPASQGSDTEYQIVKTYTSGPVSKVRRIRKPVEATIQVFDDDALEVVGGWTLDETTGVVTFAVAPDYTPRISGEFDVPVRFDTDEMNMVQLDVTAREWESINVVELKF